MDGSESLSIQDAEIQAALFFSTETRLPRMKRGTIDYINMFKEGAKTPESVDLVKALHETRVVMETKIESSSPSLREVEASLDEYLPNLYLITWSLRTQPDVPISRALHFEWRGAFTSEANFSRFDVFAYDLVMVLHSKVLHLYLSFYIYSFVRDLILSYFIIMFRRLLCISCDHPCNFAMIQQTIRLPLEKDSSQPLVFLIT